MSLATKYLDLSEQSSPWMLSHQITDRRAWTRDTVSAADWTVALSAAAHRRDHGAGGFARRRAADRRAPARPLRAWGVPGGDGSCEGRPGRRGRRRPRRPSPDGSADAGAGDRRVLGARPAPGQAGGAEVGRHDGLRRDGHRPAVRLRRPRLVDQRRADVSHRQRVRVDAARLCRAPLPHDRGGGRRQPLREPLHRAQRDAPPLPARAGAPLPAVLLRPPGRARARKTPRCRGRRASATTAGGCGRDSRRGSSGRATR